MDPVGQEDLGRTPEVQDKAVDALGRVLEEMRLEPTEPETVDVEAVKATVAKIQPYYANPSRYIKLSDFPKTANG